MTVRELVGEAEALLRSGPQPERARLDAESILQHLLRRNKAWLIGHADDVISADDANTYVDLVNRRWKGEPIQYIFREVEFYGLTLAVTPKVLIPRPETEHLVQKTLELAFHFPNPRILDVGTGSGAIAIAVAHDTSLSTSITAIDVSRASLKIAGFNARRAGFAHRVRFLHGDLLAPVAGETFEIVVSNPPYVPEADRASLSVEVREHEPALALFAGPDGLDIYRRLIPAASAALVPGGFLVLEIGYGQSPAITQLLAAAGFQSIEFLPDLRGIPRVSVAQRPLPSHGSFSSVL